MKFNPGRVPVDPASLHRYLTEEMQKVSAATDERAPKVHYRTLHVDQGSLTAGVSADYKIAAGNVVRVSTSNTVTLTGLNIVQPAEREVVLINVGTGVLVLNSQDAASSAIYRFALPTTWQLSANAAAILWYDPISKRHRGLSRT